FVVTAEVKTVNNRYLDIHLRLGQELLSAEMNIRRIISSRLSRGRVDVTINLDRTGATDYEINRQIIAEHVAGLRDIQREFNLGGEIVINSVARLPGALTPMRGSSSHATRAGI